jgi:peptide/nickel transport system ATP-binding protein
MSAPPLLDVDRASRTFRVASAFSVSRDVPALREVSFRLDAGAVLALVGESGSGKTTCGRAIAGLVALSSGRILLHGKDISEFRGARARRAHAEAVQMVSQDPFSALNPTHTIRHHLARPLKVHRRPTGDLDAEIRRALAGVELDPDRIIGKYPHQLSGGELQRVNLARALAVGADLVVADEPTSMLDVSIRRSVLELMRRLRQERGIAFLVITHDIAAAGYLADDIAVMFDGRIVEQGPSADVIGEPRHPYTRLLRAALPKIGEPFVRRGKDSRTFAARAETVREATRADTAALDERRPGQFVRENDAGTADFAD